MITGMSATEPSGFSTPLAFVTTTPANRGGAPRSVELKPRVVFGAANGNHAPSASDLPVVPAPSSEASSKSTEFAATTEPELTARPSVRSGVSSLSTTSTPASPAATAGLSASERYPLTRGKFAADAMETDKARAEKPTSACPDDSDEIFICDSSSKSEQKSCAPSSAQTRTIHLPA